MYGIQFEFRGTVFPMPSAEAALEIAGSRADVFQMKGKSRTKLDPTREGPESHAPILGRENRGRGAVAGQGPSYSTTLRCACREFRTKSNAAPSQGGRKTVEASFAQHLVEVASAL